MKDDMGMAESYTVLCVEDNLDMQEMLGFILKRAGYEAVFADNGRAGVERALEIQPDLILMDVMMPDMSGIEAVTELRQHDTFAETPIIVLSSYTAGHLIDEALAAGATTYLDKTILPKRLAEILTSYLTTGQPPEDF